MKVKYWIVLFSCFLFAILIYSCRKESYNGVEDQYLKEKQLLKEKGGTLKDGVLVFTSKPNTKHTLTLDWSTAKKYNFKGIDYTEVFFLFNPSDPINTNQSQAQKSDSSSSDEIKFSIVFRRISDTLQAVIKYTLPKTSIVNGDSIKIGKSENFYSFDGIWINSWFTDFASGRVMKKSSLPDAVIEISSSAKTKSLQTKKSDYVDYTCYTYFEKWYYYQCKEYTDNNNVQGSHDMNRICGYWFGGYSSNVYCYYDIFGGGSNMWPPGSVGGGEASADGASQSSQPSQTPKAPCPTSKEALKLAFPSASDSALNALVALINEYGGMFGIDTEHKLRHFLAQAATETGGFVNLRRSENLNYSTASRLVNVYPKYFSFINPLKRNPYNYLHNAEALANVVYSNRYGNGNVASGDGYRYRGRGIFQLTFKNNYQQFQNYYNSNFNSSINLLVSPETLSYNQTLGVISAMWYFNSRVNSRISIDGSTSVESVTKKVNGGLNGLGERKNYHNRAKRFIFCL